MSTDNSQTHDTPPPAQLPPGDERRNVWRSEELLGNDCEALIVHRGQQYRLRCTKQGKLILFK